MKYFKILTFIFLILYFSGCKEKVSGNKKIDEKLEIKNKFELSEEAFKLSDIKIDEVKRKSFSELIKIPGEVSFNYRKLAHITTIFSGIVKEVYVFEGDKVKKGEKIAGLFSKDFLSAQSDYLLTLNRYRKAIEKGDKEEISLSQRMLSSARQKLTIMGLEDEDINFILSKGEVSSILYIRAPINGTVIESSAITGASFSEGTTLFKIAEIENLWVNVNIYEKNIYKIEPGSPAIVKISSLPDREFKGKLTVIGDVVDKETRTVKGRVEVSDRTGTLKPGMFVEAFFKSKESKEIISIPESAVIKMEGKDWVFVFSDRNTFELREVKLGRNFERFREVIDGLKEGEKIVSEGGFILKSHILKERMEVE